MLYFHHPGLAAIYQTTPYTNEYTLPFSFNDNLLPVYIKRVQHC